MSGLAKGDRAAGAGHRSRPQEQASGEASLAAYWICDSGDKQQRWLGCWLDVATSTLVTQGS